MRVSRTSAEVVARARELFRGRGRGRGRGGPGRGGRRGRPRIEAVLPPVVAVMVLLFVLLLQGQGDDRAMPRGPAAPSGPRFGAPEPPVMPRSSWLRPGDEGHAREAGQDPGGRPSKQPPPKYDDKVVAVFVHHTDSPNGYDCADAPAIIRRITADQTAGRHWDDIGYNFLVDRCGTIYEGRAGGSDRPVTGAHTQGFNHRTMGVAAIGTFTQGAEVPEAMTEAIARLAAWKLGLSDVDPRGDVRLVSSNDKSRFDKGEAAVLPAIAGHDDGYRTDCPGAALKAHLPLIRERAAQLQGRSA
ncbi:peptidoglycan recognition protein family protein [Streptomyces sp. NPDC002644]